MDENSQDMYLQNLEEFVLDEDKIVSQHMVTTVIYFWEVSIDARVVLLSTNLALLLIHLG